MIAKNQKYAILCGITAVLFWSTVASAFKISLRYLDHFQLLLYSSLSSLLVLFIILLVQGKTHLLVIYTRKQYYQSIFMGFLNPFLYYVILFKAYDLLPAQEAQPLNYTWALTLTLLSIPLLKQKIGIWNFIAILISYSGVIVISTHGDILNFRFSDPYGVFLALGSTVIWALYWICNTKDGRDPVAGLFLNFVSGFPFVLGACLLFSEVPVSNFKGLAGAVYIGTFEMGITFVLWLTALKHSENTAKVSNLIFLSPFLSLIFIHYLVGEKILPSTFIGLCLIIIGLFVQMKKRKESPRKDERRFNHVEM